VYIVGLVNHYYSCYILYIVCMGFGWSVL